MKFFSPAHCGRSRMTAYPDWRDCPVVMSLSALGVVLIAVSTGWARVCAEPGRLHMKWGEALVYAGRKDEAAKHLARAAALDLTPGEKAELAGTSAGHHGI